MIPFPKTQTPLCICMWDYSWLTCGHPGGAFQDLPRRVAEAAERGYNALRVDVFPHFYMEKEHTFAAYGLDRRIRTWGDVLLPQGYTVDVRAKVIELADICRRHGIWLGLDTWQSFTVLNATRDTSRLINASEEENVCCSWADAWVRALREMREDGVLERAVWVAPLNEVPLFLGAMLASVKVSDPKTRHEGQTDFHEDMPELDSIFCRINQWLGEAVKDEILRDGIALSYSALGAENYAARLTDLYDIVDIHFMPDLILSEDDKAALEKSAPGASAFSMHDALAGYDLALYSAAWERACSRQYGRMLALAHAYARGALARTTLSSGKKLPAVVTEAYGPCNFPNHPEVRWDWYKLWNGDAARIFASYDFSGLTLSNHAEPIFSLWEDVPWQRTANLFIQNSVSSSLPSAL